MSVEERLVAALRTTDDFEPSADLWSRVVHSIEEDRAHRRRVLSSALSVAAAAAVLVVVAALSLTDGTAGRQVRLGVMEVIETVALVVLIAVLGPAIRRFGRGYATDLWSATPPTATALVRLLDIAYLLVCGGFVLVTAQFDTGPSRIVVGGQIQDLGERVGGLLLVMGLLHAVTIMTLPVVALVSNTTRTGRALPRWLVIVLLIAALALGPPLMLMMVGAIAGAAGA